MPSLSTFQPFELIEGDRGRGLLIVADHAGRDLPQEYGRLGLPPAEFDRHIAYDIGVEGVTRRLAALTGAPAVMARFSRLLIDPNRGEDDPTLIRQLYDGTIVPGNYPLPPEERARRIAAFHAPYHGAVAALVASVAAASGRAPFVFSVHSFTPVMRGIARPWHVGILWDSDARAVKPLLSMLRAEPGLVVGDNEPYDGALRGDTMYRHAILEGFPHALVEIRQDLIANAAGQEEWAARLAPMLAAVNASPNMHQARQFGSRTGPLRKDWP